MKTLTVKQPWASLIVEGMKDIENRTWRTNYRGTVLIHSSARIAYEFADLCTRPMWDAISDEMKGKLAAKNLELSAIIGQVDIIDVITKHPSIWAQHSDTDKPIYNWVLANPVIFPEPIINIPGKLLLWEFTDHEKMYNATMKAIQKNNQPCK